RPINASALWPRVQALFGFQAGYSDQSTLTSEIETTGLVEGSQRQQQATGQGSWALQESQRMQLTIQAGYTDIKYVGLGFSELNGYRQPTLAIAQRFSFR